MSDSLAGKSLANLREAFIALHKSKVTSPHGDIGPCLSLIRLRDLAQKPYITTSTDSRHLTKCHKCSVRFQAMQLELDITPPALFEAALSQVKRKYSRFAVAERFARDLFHRLHARGELDRISTWQDIHGPALALRRHHCPGEEENAESIVEMTMSAIGSALADASTPFARSLDAIWPLAAMLVKLGAEAARHQDRVPAQFVHDYAALVAVVPIPIKAMLTYNLHALLDCAPTERIAREIAIRVTYQHHPATSSVLELLAAIERLDRNRIVPRGTQEWNLLSVDNRLTELNDRLRVHSDVCLIGNVVQRNVCEMMCRIFESDDSTEQLVQLLLTRHYLSSAATSIQEQRPHAIESVLGDVARMVMHNAQLADHQYFAATEVLSAIGPTDSVMHVMAELLATPDEDLRRALFVRFANASDHTSSEVPFGFAGHGAKWVFEGNHDAPIATFGNRAAAMANDDHEIASLIDWSRLHLEAHGEEMKMTVA